MSKQAAAETYRDSLYHAAELKAEMRIGSRSIPIVGGFIPGLKLIGNGLARPFKILGSLMFGSATGQSREFPAMPAIPEIFKGTDLETSFKQSWALQKQAADANVESLKSLLNLEIVKSTQQAAVASHAEAKDMFVTFPEEGAAMNAGAGAGAGFAAGIASSRSSGGIQR